MAKEIKARKQNKDKKPTQTHSELPDTIYNEDIYTHVPVLDLMTFGIFLVLRRGETCTFEKLVAECFTLFPKVFGLKRYPQWPDTLKFDRATRTLREKGLVVGGIGGKKSSGEFKLTEFGIALAQKTEHILTNNNTTQYVKKKSSHTIRSVNDKLIEYIQQSKIYNSFIENSDDFTITEPELRNLLRCTLETPVRVVKQNLAYFKNTVKEYGENEMLNFLIVCENKIFKS